MACKLPAAWIPVEEACRAIRTGRGQGVRVAILDSGVESDHPGLDGLLLADDLAFNLNQNEVIEEPGGAKDIFGHGTAVAGIVRSLAPAAEIGSFRVLRSSYDGLTSKSEIIERGALAALERGYHILNCSFGCQGQERFLMRFKHWVDQAYLRGAHVVSACNNADFTTREWPAHFPSVIAVDKAEVEVLDRVFYRPGNLVEFKAKGRYTGLLWSGRGSKSDLGSSFAAPVAAALLARLLSHCPALSPLAAKELLRLTAERWSEPSNESSPSPA